MVTPGCCCWYFEKAAAKNGASNVDPAPDRVGLCPLGPMLATADAEPPVALGGLVLLQAATTRTMMAAAATMARRVVRRSRGPGSAGWPDMAAPLRRIRSGTYCRRAARVQAWAAIWTASQGLPSGGV